MMPTLGRRRALVAAVAAAMLSLTACGSDSADTSSGSSSGDTGSAFPVSLNNTFGTAEIEEKPEKVATVNWGNHDVPIALGIVPVGIAKANYGDDDKDGMLPWTTEALEGLGADKMPTLFDETDAIDFEAVANTEPNVILAAYSGLTDKDYTTLSEIAPTVSFPQVAWGTNWKDMALINGEALGMKEEAEEKVAEVEDTIEKSLAERPDVTGKSVAYVWYDVTDPSKLWVYSPLDARVQLLGDLGMKNSTGVEKLFEASKEFGLEISSEKVDQIADADIVALYGDDKTLSTMQKDPLVGKVPAIKRGSVVVLPDNTPQAAATSGPTVLSIPWVVEDYLDLFQGAATKIG